MHSHDKGSHASVTPACDGQRVFVNFMVQEGARATALDFQAKIVWQKQVAPFKSPHGYGPSPLLYRWLVIVPADNPGPNYLTALRRDTGEVVWRIHRTDYHSFASPSVGRVAGRDQLAGKMFVLQTGREFKLIAENDLQDGGLASAVTYKRVLGQARSRASLA